MTQTICCISDTYIFLHHEQKQLLGEAISLVLLFRRQRVMKKVVFNIRSGMIGWFLGFTQSTLISSTLLEDAIFPTLIQSHAPICTYDIVGIIGLSYLCRNILIGNLSFPRLYFCLWKLWYWCL